MKTRKNFHEKFFVSQKSKISVKILILLTILLISMTTASALTATMEGNISLENNYLLWSDTMLYRSIASNLKTANSLTVNNDLTVDTDTLYVNSTNNRVGIGTATPGTELDVNGEITAGTGTGKALTAEGNIKLTGGGSNKSIFLSGSSNELLSIDNNANGDIRFRTGTNDRFHITAAGRVGIKDNTPSYTLDVSGDIHATGKVTSDGGYDPPYVLYNYETRDSIINRVKQEVTPDKLNGAVLFFNGIDKRPEIFIPSLGEFKDFNGNILTTVQPITKTFETKTKYYLDSYTGEVKSIQVPLLKKYSIKAGYEIDSATGKFYKVEEDGLKHEVLKEEAIMVT